MVGEETWLPPLKSVRSQRSIRGVIRFLHAKDIFQTKFLDEIVLDYGEK